MSSEKKDKGYDATLARFAGNLLSNDIWRGSFSTQVGAEKAAIESAIRVRNALKKIALDEEAKGAV